MRRPCKALQHCLKSELEHLPDALQVHLAECVRCRRAWQLEQAYRRAVAAARHEPVPICDLPWARVQAKLAEHAVMRSAPRWGQYAIAGSLALVALAASLVWLARGSQTPVASHLLQPTPRVDTPRPTETVPALIKSSASELSWREPRPIQVAAARTNPRVAPQPRLRVPLSAPNPIRNAPQEPLRTQQMAVEVQMATPHSESLSIKPHDALAGQSAEPETGFAGADTAELFTIAILPLSQFELYNNIPQVEYLPI